MKSVVRARNAVLVMGMETLTATYTLAPSFCMVFASKDGDAVPGVTGPALVVTGIDKLAAEEGLTYMSVPKYLQQVG
jgi:hypothetical protein